MKIDNFENSYLLLISDFDLRLFSFVEKRKDILLQGSIIGLFLNRFDWGPWERETLDESLLVFHLKFIECC